MARSWCLIKEKLHRKRNCLYERLKSKIHFISHACIAEKKHRDIFRQNTIQFVFPFFEMKNTSPLIRASNTIFLLFASSTFVTLLAERVCNAQDFQAHNLTTTFIWIFPLRYTYLHFHACFHYFICIWTFCRDITIQGISNGPVINSLFACFNLRGLWKSRKNCAHLQDNTGSFSNFSRFNTLLYSNTSTSQSEHLDNIFLE